MKNAVLKLSLSFFCFALLFTATPVLKSSVGAFAPGDVFHGCIGTNVQELQSRLKYLGYYHGKVDSIFGWDTYWAVRRFQYRFGLKIDGIAGPKTKAMLVKATKNWGKTAAKTNSAQTGSSRAQSSGSTSSSVSSAPIVSGLTKNDLNLMAHLVSGEARGEPFIGQVAVADVVLHRVQSSKYPNTVAGVIYQPGAFSAVSDGQINVSVAPQAMQAVVDAVHGWDPSHGALNYFNPAKTNNAYVWSRPEIIKIGHHIFTK